eukprot:7750591-Pyramimonas_sp.AAC.1
MAFMRILVRDCMLDVQSNMGVCVCGLTLSLQLLVCFIWISVIVYYCMWHQRGRILRAAGKDVRNWRDRMTNYLMDDDHSIFWGITMLAEDLFQ